MSKLNLFCIIGILMLVFSISVSECRNLVHQYSMQVYDCPKRTLVLNGYSLEMANFLNFQLDLEHVKRIASEFGKGSMFAGFDIPFYGLAFYTQTIDDRVKPVCSLIDSFGTIGHLAKDHYKLYLGTARKDLFAMAPKYEFNLYKWQYNDFQLNGCTYPSSADTVYYVPDSFTDKFFNMSTDNFCSDLHSKMKNDGTQYNLYHGHPMIIIPSSGTTMKDLACRRKNKQGEFLTKKDYYWTLPAHYLTSGGDTTTKNNIVYENYNKWLNCIRTASFEDVNDQAETFVPDFGQHRHHDLYFIDYKSITESFKYEPGVNLRIAPYDFRKSPDQLDDYYLKLKHLIEQTYYINGYRKVILLSTYIGGFYSMVFLNSVTQAWKDKYLASLVTVGTPWYGTANALQQYLEPYSPSSTPLHTNIKQLEIDRRRLELDIQILSPATTVALPYGDSESSPIFQTPNDTLMPLDYAPFFKSIGLPSHEIIGFRKGIEKRLEKLSPPGVEFHCIYGTGIPTNKTFIGPNFGTIRGSIETDGDGYVTVESAEACKEFKHLEHGDKVHVIPASGLPHGMIDDRHLRNVFFHI